jgi:hypothetical protein
VAEDLLDIVDRRTLVKFVQATGGRDGRMPANTDLYLAEQRFVVKPEFLSAVRHALETRDDRAVIVMAPRCG